MTATHSMIDSYNASRTKLSGKKVSGKKASRGLVAGFWISTALFALQMSFTAYAQLRLPQVAENFARLGFPAYFRIELSWAKLVGVAVLLVPMISARRDDFLYLLKEWAYAGFAITLVSALIAHLAVGDGVKAWSWSVGTGVLWGVSYFFWRRLQPAVLKFDLGADQCKVGRSLTGPDCITASCA